MLGVTLLPATAPAVGTLLALLGATALLLYLYATRHFGYWRRKGVPFLRPLPFVGNILDVVLFRKHYGDVLKEFHNNEKNARYFGMFAFDQPILFVKDLRIWKHIMQSDFSYFHDRAFTPGPSDTLNVHQLFTKKGKPWKDLRNKLSPAFTSGKLKKFYGLIEEKARYLDTFFEEGVKTGKPQNVSDACGRYTTDVVASVGFGIECSSLVDDDSYFRKVLKNTFIYNKAGLIRSIAWFSNVPAMRYPGSKLIPDALARYLRSSIWATVAERQAAGAVGRRGDFLDLIIELRDKGSIADDDASAKGDDGPKTKLSLEGDAFISQAWTFLAAGFETSSTTMSFALHHLARNQDVQDELRARLQSALADSGGKLTYEVLQSVAYLEMVVLETLRLHPILPFLDRVCTKEYRIPDSDLVLDKGIIVLCSLLGIQTDPDIYPDPERFDPDRFTEEEKQRRPPCSFMAFGDGPRICIGQRLGLLQAKLGLAHIILNYKVHPIPNTPYTMKYNLYTFLLNPNPDIHLLFTRV